MKLPAAKLGLGLLFGLLSCSGAAIDTEDPRLEESRALIRAFAVKLQAELKQGLSNGGPVAAITICKDRAPQIASELSRQSGAKIGRTSLKYRNPANAPEPWQIKALEDFAEDAKVSGTSSPLELFTTDAAGTARYLSIIYVGGVCLACHGDAIDPDVAVILESEYPHDQALGYALGDIRGAFSVTWPRTGNVHGS